MSSLTHRQQPIDSVKLFDDMEEITGEKRQGDPKAKHGYNIEGGNCTTRTTGTDGSTDETEQVEDLLIKLDIFRNHFRQS